MQLCEKNTSLKLPHCNYPEPNWMTKRPSAKRQWVSGGGPSTTAWMAGNPREILMKSYLPINEHGNGKSTFYVGNTSSNGPFPIAMLVYWVCKNKKTDWRILAWRKILDQALLHSLTPPTGYIILCWNTLLKSWTHGRQILPATSSHLINKNIPSLLLPRKITWVAETNRQLISYKPSRFCFGRSRNPSSPKGEKNTDQVVNLLISLNPKLTPLAPWWELLTQPPGTPKKK